MAKTVEVFYTIQNGRPSIKFHIAEEVEGAAEEKVVELLKDLPIPKEVVDSLPSIPAARLLSSNEVEVYDAPSKKASGSKSFSSKSGGKITEKQLWCIQNHLKKMGIAESEFCQQHGINRLEDMPKRVATDIVSDISELPGMRLFYLQLERKSPCSN